MKHPLISPALLCLFASFAHSQEEQPKPQESEGLQAPQPVESGDKDSPLHKVSTFCNDHPTLRYTIFDYRKTIGQCIQRTNLSRLKTGVEVIDLVDSYKYNHSDDVRVIRTRAYIDEHYDIFEVSGEMGPLGSAGARIRNGVISGVDIDKKPFSFEAVPHLMTRNLLQRGFYDLPLVVDETQEIEMFALENTRKEEITTKATITYKGTEDVEAQGVTYPDCRRYVFRVVGERGALQYWYDQENRLIKSRTNVQTWELMAKGQAEPLPVKRRPNPLRQRQRAKEEGASEADQDQR